jgi:S-DNA-T family DNA segregation ATPase FtsK/SpoIIIE
LASTKQSKRQATIKKRLKKERLINELIGILLLFLSMFGFYSLFAQNAGLVGEAYIKGCKFLFGDIGSFALMTVLLICSIYIIFQYRPLRMNKKIFLLLILLINFCVILHINSIDTIGDPFFKNIFDIAAEQLQENAGGLIGMGLAKLIVELFSVTGAYLFIIFISIGLILFIFRKSIGEIIHNLMDKRETNHKDKKLVNDILSEENNKLNSDDKSFAQVEKWMAQLDDNGSGIHHKNRGKHDEKDNHELKDIPKQKDAELIKIELNKESEAAEESHANDAKKDTVNANIQPNEVKNDKYVFPPISLLNEYKSSSESTRQETLKNAEKLQNTLASFGISAKLVGISVGPTVTRYELEPQAGIRVNKIVNLSDDIALALAAPRVRIEAPIPGKSAVGIEIPNKNITTVHIREVIASKEFKGNKSPVAVALGKNLSGQNLMCDLKKMPHMLIAGATGSGKSVCVNAILASILYRSSPKDVRLILIDPKMVELNIYNGIPHLLVPVVVDPKQAASALNWAVMEMMDRYQKFADNKVRDIKSYNDKLEKEGQAKLPLIVIIIDELADLMAVAPQQVEGAICRLAQLARAAGLHLVLATQRPSVDVITGLIKANIPSRISFMVSSQVDSRTIIDMAGAEKLLGNGDMLYYPAGTSQPQRAQCAYIDQKEVERMVDFIKKRTNEAYNNEIIEKINSPKSASSDYNDELFDEAVTLAMERGQISTSMIQRKLRIGYARAGRMVDEMEERGIISPADGSRPRNVLITYDEYFSQKNDGKEEAAQVEEQDG